MLCSVFFVLSCLFFVLCHLSFVVCCSLLFVVCCSLVAVGRLLFGVLRCGFGVRRLVVCDLRYVFGVVVCVVY